MFEKNDKKQETPQRNLRRFLYWGEPKKEHFVLRDRTLRFIFSERFVLRIILETKEPTHRAFSSLSYAFENLMNMYSLVFADSQWCAVNEAYARAFAQEDLLDKQG